MSFQCINIVSKRNKIVSIQKKNAQLLALETDTLFLFLLITIIKKIIAKKVIKKITKYLMLYRSKPADPPPHLRKSQSWDKVTLYRY